MWISRGKQNNFICVLCFILFVVHKLCILVATMIQTCETHWDNKGYNDHCKNYTIGVYLYKNCQITFQGNDKKNSKDNQVLILPDAQGKLEIVSRVLNSDALDSCWRSQRRALEESSIKIEVLWLLYWAVGVIGIHTLLLCKRWQYHAFTRSC